MPQLAQLLDLLAEVWYALRAHKVRSLLTLLGMIIGAGSMVLLAGLLAGGEEALSATAQNVSQGDVVRVDNAAAPPQQRGRTARSLSRGDQDALETAEGVIQRWQVAVRYRGERRDAALFGTSERGAELYALPLLRGRFFDAADVRDKARVAVVGYELWRDLLGEPQDLRGIQLQVDGAVYQVVGALAHKPAVGGGSRRGRTWDGRVLVPLTTLQLLNKEPRALQSLYVRVVGGRGASKAALEALLDPARRLTRSLLMRRHYGVENFKVDRNREFRQQEDLIFLVINVLMLCTAGLSLLVGGINIMNIMLVTVTERTREIGIRRSLGATRGDILLQFLLESALIAALGGLCGVAAGAALVALASFGLQRWLGVWSAHYEVWAMALGLSLAAVTGVLFGLYPAWRASRLDPVEALRFE